MLLYHPAFDAYHCLFRSILLLQRLDGQWIQKDKLRILDFYLLFPREISTISLPQLMLKEKQKFASFPQYESISNPATVFYQLEEIFENTVKTLVAFKLVELNTTQDDTFRYVKRDLPPALNAMLDARRNEYAAVLTFLFTYLQPISLHGPDGLKHKTHLLPSRYDRK